MRPFLNSAALALTLAAVPMAGALAQHEGHGVAAGQPASVDAYIAAMDTMHEAMNAMDYTGDADVDFAVGMIPHHQAAIDMARIVLEHGSDPEIRALAEAIIAAQEAEIAQLRDWLAARGY